MTDETLRNGDSVDQMTGKICKIVFSGDLITGWNGGIRSLVTGWKYIRIRSLVTGWNAESVLCDRLTGCNAECVFNDRLESQNLFSGDRRQPPCTDKSE